MEKDSEDEEVARAGRWQGDDPEDPPLSRLRLPSNKGSEDKGGDYGMESKLVGLGDGEGEDSLKRGDRLAARIVHIDFKRKAIMLSAASHVIALQPKQFPCQTGDLFDGAAVERVFYWEVKHVKPYHGTLMEPRGAQGRTVAV